MADKALTPAAACIRMSGRTQDKSPLSSARRSPGPLSGEGRQVVDWFTDEAITGDSSTSSRPGLAALLHGAQAGAFKVVLAGTATASAVKARWTPSALQPTAEGRSRVEYLLRGCHRPRRFRQKQLLLFCQPEGKQRLLAGVKPTTGKRLRCQFVQGNVELRQQSLFSIYGVVEDAFHRFST